MEVLYLHDYQHMFEFSFYTFNVLLEESFEKIELRNYANPIQTIGKSSTK